MSNSSLRTPTTDDEQPTTPQQSDADRDPVLELDGVVKEYGPETAVNSLSLDVREGELLTMLGPSGCGKTTTLRMMAGLERPDGGEIRLRGERISG